MNFSYLVLLLLQRLLLLLLPVPGWASTIAPKNSLMSLLKPTENADFSYFFLLFPPAAAAPAPATPSVQKDPSAAAAPAPATPSVQKAPPGCENTMAAKGEK